MWNYLVGNDSPITVIGVIFGLLLGIGTILGIIFKPICNYIKKNLEDEERRSEVNVEYAKLAEVCTMLGNLVGMADTKFTLDNEFERVNLTIANMNLKHLKSDEFKVRADLREFDEKLRGPKRQYASHGALLSKAERAVDFYRSKITNEKTQSGLRSKLSRLFR